jgi:hypothetical protein
VAAGRRWRDLARGPLDPTRAWALLAVNLTVLPGLGSALAGRKISGIAQAALALAGAGLCAWWLVLFIGEWSRTGEYPWGGGGDLELGLFGVALFAAGWLWSLATSAVIIRSLRTEATETRRNGEK